MFKRALPAFLRLLALTLLSLAWPADAFAQEWVRIGSIETKAGETTATFRASGQAVRYAGVRAIATTPGVRITRMDVKPAGVSRTGDAPSLEVTLGPDGGALEAVAVKFSSTLKPGTPVKIQIYARAGNFASAQEDDETSQDDRPKKKKKAAKFDDAAVGAPAPPSQTVKPRAYRYEYRAPDGQRNLDANTEARSDDVATGPSGGSSPPAKDAPATARAPSPREMPRSTETAEVPPAPPPPPRTIASKPAAAEPAAVAPGAGQPAPNVCQDQKVCTPVGVFFGTDRDNKPGPHHISFGSERNDRLTLGHAFVTVPKARAKGEIPLPSLWDLYVRRVPETGDPARHFTILQNGITLYDSEDAFIAAIKQHMAGAGEFKDHAFVFIHGFRVAFEEALFRTAQIAYDLAPEGQPFGTAFLYSWPSAADASAYLFDEDSARLAIPHLEKFLRLVIDKTGAKHVHLIAHSMGNVPLINALKNVTTQQNAPRINQIVLAAPDFDKKEFEKVVSSIAPFAEGITLYASSTDYAMKIARKARRLPRAGDATTPPGPAIISGIDTVDVSALDSSIFSWNHNNYAESKELLTDMSALFRNGVRPPAARSGKFKLQNSEGGGQFWRWVK